MRLFIYINFKLFLHLFTRRIECDWRMYVRCDAAFCSTVHCCVQNDRATSQHSSVEAQLGSHTTGKINDL